MHAVWILLYMVLLQSLSEMVFTGWSSTVSNMDNMVVLNPVKGPFALRFFIQLFRQSLSHKSVKAYGTIPILSRVVTVWRGFVEVHCLLQEGRRSMNTCTCWY